MSRTTSNRTGSVRSLTINMDPTGDRDLRTSRLELRPLALTDTESLHALWTAPGVRRYLWDDEVIPLEQTSAVVAESMRLFETAGYGLWGARLHSATDLVGFGGYWFFHEPPRLELLFGLAESQWGKGLAAELASSLITFGLTRCGFREVLASTDALNDRSVRLLARLGFQLERRATSKELDTLFFRHAGFRATWPNASCASSA